jgi:acetyltransferase
MATDALIRPGITLARLSEETKEKLRGRLPPTASVHNPVDVIGDADSKRYDAAIRYALEDENVDGAIVILGSTRDPRFGPVCMFGLGGIFVEAMKDVTFRLAPMWETSAENMIKSIKAYSVLQGIRGKPPADIKAVKLNILRLSAMVSNHPEIAELDINPLIVYPEGQGCVVADARIVLSRPEVR